MKHLDFQGPKKALRPVEFSYEDRDCTVRTLSITAKIPYSEAHAAFKKCGRKDKHSVYITKILQLVCKELNLTAKQVKRSGSLRKFIRTFSKGRYFCSKSGHAFAVVDGVLHDENTLGSHIQGAWLITKG